MRHHAITVLIEISIVLCLSIFQTGFSQEPATTKAPRLSLRQV